MVRPIESLYERFERFTDKSGNCWIWTGATTKDGYGKFTIQGSNSPDGKIHTMRASRVAWFLAKGVWLTPDVHVLHKCDTPLCVKKDHLFLGDNIINAIDKVTKGRAASHANGKWNAGVKPENAHMAILNFDLANQIREEYASGGITHLQLGKNYGVSESAICMLINNKTWIRSK